MLQRTSRIDRRRGTITPFLLMALVVMMAALAVAVDYSILSDTRLEMRNTTDACAPAGADVLVDDGTLMNNPAVLRTLVSNSAQAAITYGQFNRVGGQPLVIDPNTANLADGDIVYGYIDDPATKIFVQALAPTDPINAVRITGRRTRARGNPVGTFASRAFGLSFVDVRTRSVALIDHNVIGFRQNTSQPIPLAPIAILSDPANATTDTASWEYNVQQGNGPLVDNGLLHGIVVTLTSPGSGTPNSFALSIGSGAVGTQVQTGITTADLASFGGQFVLDATNHLTVPLLDTTDFTSLTAGLTALQASAVQRVYPLYSTYDSTNNDVILSGFVAARVVNVVPMNGGVTFTLQPTVLAVPSALTDASRRGVGGVAITNPYVVKVHLVQ